MTSCQLVILSQYSTLEQGCTSEISISRNWSRESLTTMDPDCFGFGDFFNYLFLTFYLPYSYGLRPLPSVSMTHSSINSWTPILHFVSIAGWKISLLGLLKICFNTDPRALRGGKSLDLRDISLRTCKPFPI